MNPRILSAAALGLALLAGSALAHHSFAMFDTAHPLTMKGTVKQLDWTNPHTFLWVYGETGPGEAPVLWSFETSSPGNLTRAGWSKRSFQAGDKVQVAYYPMRDGQHAGQIIEATQSATGKAFNLKPVPPPPAPAAQ